LISSAQCSGRYLFHDDFSVKGLIRPNDTSYGSIVGWISIENLGGVATLGPNLWIQPADYDDKIHVWSAQSEDPNREVRRFYQTLRVGEEAPARTQEAALGRNRQ
jgi:hypothetical protein